MVRKLDKDLASDLATLDIRYRAARSGHKVVAPPAVGSSPGCGRAAASGAQPIKGAMGMQAAIDSPGGRAPKQRVAPLKQDEVKQFRGSSP